MRHATLSPSSLGAIEKCPGRPAAIATLGPDRQTGDSPAAARGTLLHDLAVKCVTDPGAYIAGRMVGALFPLSTGAYELTQDDALAVQMAVTYYQDREQLYGAPGQYEVKVYPGAAAHLDSFNPSTGVYDRAPVDYSEVCYGTADAVFQGAGVLEVVDLKFGRILVPENSLQLVAYALGALKDIELTPETAVQRVRTTIVQPGGVGQRIRTKEWTLDEMMEQALRLGRVCEAALAKAPVRIPGEAQCRFCEFKPRCPEHVGAMGQAIELSLAGEPSTTETSTHTEDVVTNLSISETLVQALTGDDDAMTMESMLGVLESAPMLRSWLKSIEERLLTLAMSGAEVPGMKVVQGNGRRIWGIEEDALLKKMGNWSRIGEDGKTAGKLKREEYTEVKVISAPQAEKRIKPLVSARTWSSIEGLITKQPGAPVLVPVTDNRTPLRMDVDDALGGDEEADLSFLS